MERVQRPSVARWGPYHWLGLAFLGPLLCFIITTVYVTRWAARIDEDARSIAENGAPGVLHLSTAREDIALIKDRVMQATPSTINADRAAIEDLTRDFDEAVQAYRMTEDYPGEREAYEVMSRQRAVFFAAVAGALAQVESGEAARHASLAQVTRAADDLIAAGGALVRLNAGEISAASHEIGILRHRASALSYSRDALAFLLALGGTLMAFRGARQKLSAVAESNRLNEARAAELDLFAGRVAHDLRNPLSAIVMRCATAELSPRPDAAHEALTRVSHQARRMGEIIDALLAFARSGAQPDPGKTCEIGAVTREVATEAQPSAAEARIDLVVDQSCAGVVACDPSVLAVILSNLVRNAIKYMGDDDDGPRRITLRAESRGALMRLAVEDTGPGIPPGSETRVFEPFVRLSSGAESSGVGLGLATVKRLVEAHGGRAGVESKVSRGCRFWFTLPKAEAEREGR